VRELHIYSQTTFVGDHGQHVQHQGLGTRLMDEAEKIAKNNWFYKIAVIAGNGAQTFYERLGYTLHGTGDFMIKRL
jgi:elongator complex protein 3